MTGINDLSALVLATLAFLAIPGPGTIKMLTAMGEPQGGARAGAWSVLGLMSGDTVWMVLALSGVAALAAAHPLAFDVLRYAGAAYLAWIGLSLFRRPPPVAAAEAGAVPLQVRPRGPRGPRQWFREAMLVSLSNPKVIGFYVAFFPLFIDPVTFDGVATYARMIGVVLALGVAYSLFLVALAQQLRHTLGRRPAVVLWLKRLAGTALVGFAAKFALQR